MSSGLLVQYGCGFRQVTSMQVIICPVSSWGQVWMCSVVMACGCLWDVSVGCLSGGCPSSVWGCLSAMSVVMSMGYLCGVSQRGISMGCLSGVSQ